MELYAVVKVYEVNGQTKVEAPFCSDDLATVQKERERLLAAKAPGTIIATAEVGDYQLSTAGMLEVSDAYDRKCVRTTVLYSLRDRYPDVDETRPEVQKLIDDLASHAYEDVSKGSDEDWSVDDAFRYFKKSVANICGED